MGVRAAQHICLGQLVAARFALPVGPGSWLDKDELRIPIKNGGGLSLYGLYIQNPHKALNVKYIYLCVYILQKQLLSLSIDVFSTPFC